VYYGNLAVPTENPEAVDAPVFLVFGEADTSTTVQSAEALAAKLSDQGTSVDAVFYPKLGHAFANPSNAGHDPEATRDAWEQTLSFLNENIR
jgi:carboxymethylenebutenolidase